MTNSFRVWKPQSNKKFTDLFASYGKRLGSISKRILLATILLFPLSGRSEGPTRPLVFLPGILGSNLYLSDDNVYDINDQRLWGGKDSYSNFAKLNLSENDKIIAHGIIDTVKILGPIKIKQYSELIKALESFGYVIDRDLFLFGYDWRKSNISSSDSLNSYIDDCAVRKLPCSVLSQGEFDILAHSMGGIVAQAFIHRNVDKAKRIKNIISLGTPYLGSHAATETLINGFQGLAKYLAKDPEIIKEVMFSFESGFELAPRYNRCCFIGDNWSEVNAVTLDSIEPWKLMAPKTKNWGDIAALVEAGLENRKVISLMMDTDDFDIEFTHFASSNITTTSQLLLRPNKTSKWKRSNGDGRVLLSSAANSSIGFSRASMSEHSHIFDDKYVVESLRRILILNDENLPFSQNYNPCSRNPNVGCFQIGDFSVISGNLQVAPSIGSQADSFKLEVHIELDELKTENFPDLDLCISVEDRDSEDLDCVYSSVINDWTVSNHIVSAIHALPVLAISDYRVSVSITGQEQFVDFYSVLENPNR